MNSFIDYYSRVRVDLFRYIQKGDNEILDVGCGAGRTGSALIQQGLASNVVGVELHRPAADIARSQLNEVYCCDIEKFDFQKLGGNRFDYVICADVLEHLRDPWDITSNIHSCLKREGKLIVSLPNVRHYSVSLALLFRGRWRYTEAGILDATHLRFFTRASMMELFSKDEYQLDVCEAHFFGRMVPLANKLSVGIFEDILVPQWNIVLVSR